MSGTTLPWWNANFPDTSVLVLINKFHADGAIVRVGVELCEQFGGPAREWLNRFVCAHGATLGRGDNEGNVECLIIALDNSLRFADQADAAVRLAAAGLGVVIVPENIVPGSLRRHVLPLDPRIYDPLAVLTRGTWSPQAEAFRDVLQAVDWLDVPADAIIEN